MLVTASRLIGAPVLSVQIASKIADISYPIVDPDSLKILGFVLSGPLINRNPAHILDVSSIREYSRHGFVIDSVDELITQDDVIRISDVLALNFDLIGLHVETKKGHKLGKVSDYTVTNEDFIVQQIIVKRPLVKGFLDPELTISRQEIVEITDYKIIVKDEEKTLRARAENEDFVPNFVNPFRKSGQEYAPSKSDEPEL